MMEFELLRSFVAMAECGGFHRAAAFRFARRSAHCAARKRIGLADPLREPQSYGCPRRSPGWSRDHAASGERVRGHVEKIFQRVRVGHHAHQIVAGRPLAPNAESAIEKAIEEFRITNP